MYCKQCGTQIADDAKFCSVCGTRQDLIPPAAVESQGAPEVQMPPEPDAPPAPHTWRCATCGNMIDREPCVVCARGPQTAVSPRTNNNRVFHCPTCGQQQNHRDYCHSCGQLFSDIHTTPSTSAFSMRYYHFLVDFLFYAAAAVNFITAILYIAGTISVGLGKAVDVLFALYSIGMGAFSLVIRDRMAKFQKDGLSWFRIHRYIGISFAFISMIINITALDNAASYLMTEEAVALSTFSFLCGFAISVGVAAAELSYFKKRESLFIN